VIDSYTFKKELVILNILMSIKLVTYQRAIKPNDSTNYNAQKNKEVFFKKVGDNEAYKVVQGTKHLYLGPGEVFFDQLGALTCGGTTKNTDGLNQNKDFKYIDGLKKVGDTVHWPFYLGGIAKKIKIYVKMDVKFDNGSELIFNISNQHIIDVPLKKKATDQYAFVIKLNELNPGRHFIKITVKKNNNGLNTSLGKLYYLKMSSRNGAKFVIRERWRPLAAHTTFYYDSQHNRNKSWVMEVKKLASLSCFSPITTPFGYYGPVMDKNGLSNGVNFSLWSFGRTQKPPPIHQYSRILAIGSPKGIFSGFTHEGTGAKIINFNPWEGTNVSKRYVMSLRFEDAGMVYSNGRIYTFYSYYWDEIGEEWRLYGIGQQFSTKELKSLFIKAFVEVPGVAEKQRSNHIERTVLYKGYAQGMNDEWNRINTMKAGYLGAEHTNKYWTITPNNMFSVSAGGLKQRYPANMKSIFKINVEEANKEIHNLDLDRGLLEDVDDTVEEIMQDDSNDEVFNNFDPNDDLDELIEETSEINKSIDLEEDMNDDFPLYMRPDKLEAIKTFTIIPTIKSHKIEGGKCLVNINIPDKDDHLNDVTVYYGRTDGLSILSLWDKNHKLFNLPNGDSTIKINYNEDVNFLRVLFKDRNYQVWSFTTYQIKD
jgi:hypothetical protein